MKIDGQGLLVRIDIGESDQWHGAPLYHAIVELLRTRPLIRYPAPSTVSVDSRWIL